LCCAGQAHILVPKISIEHLKCLTKMVSSLCRGGLVHGDLRLPNIIFCEDGKITLIDFEWAGPAETAKFPNDVNREAFGKRAQQLICSSGSIPLAFDWRCLADIFECFESYPLVHAACICDETAVLAKLDAERDNSLALNKLLVQGKDPSHIYLGRISPRIRAYFMKSRRTELGGATRKRGCPTSSGSSGSSRSSSSSSSNSAGSEQMSQRLRADSPS
jgi:serine/threonine protein kinase